MTSHRYVREFEPSSGNSLALLAKRIPAGATVLELGPAGGYFTRHLRENLNCTIDAVEIDPAMADAARTWCRTMIVGDLEALDLTALLPARAYDVVLMADVLEHLHNPSPLLQQLHPLLKPEGCCLISVPNVAYGGLIASLLGGEFDYRDEGLLDRTHLRFYTRRSLLQLLEHSGWFPCAWQSVQLSFWESEFRTRLETLPTALVDILASRPELACYQWLVEARAEPTGPVPEPSFPEAWPGGRFPIRLFWADGTIPFDYAHSRIVWGQVGALRKVEEFVLNDDTNATRLRLCLADRPAFIRLYEIVLRDADRKILWQWTAADGVARLANACSGMQLGDAGEHAMLLLNEQESWLDIAWQGVADAPARTVHLLLGWPQSADFVAAQATWEASVRPLRAELDAVKALVGTRDHELATREGSIRAQQEKLQAREEEISDLRQRLDGQTAQTTTLQAQIARMQTVSGWLTQPLHELRKLLIRTNR